MLDGTHITIQVDGRTVEGEITSLGPTDIWVEITNPYSGLQTTRHVPVLAREHVSFTHKDSQINAYGIKRAEELLEELYRFLIYFDENRPVLEERYREMKERVRVLESTYLSDELFAEERQKLKKLMKAGEIDNREYQKRLIPLRKSNEAFDGERFALWREFVDNNFPDGVPIVPEEMVMAMLEGKDPEEIDENWTI